MLKKDLLSLPKYFHNLKEAIIVFDTIYTLTKQYINYDESVWVKFETHLGVFNYDVVNGIIYTEEYNSFSISNLGYITDVNELEFSNI